MNQRTNELTKGLGKKFVGSLVPKFVGSVMMLFIMTSCMDKLPVTLRKGEELAKTQVYGYRSDKWQQVEDSYLAGQANCCGPDKRNDDITALGFYCKAAKEGHKASQIEVARFYLHEAGAGAKTAVPFDRAVAHAYFSLAAQGGYEYAATMVAGLEPKLTPEELEQSKTLVAGFPAIPCEITK